MNDRCHKEHPTVVAWACDQFKNHLSNHTVRDGIGGRIVDQWENKIERTMTDAEALDILLDTWKRSDILEGFPGADAVDLIEGVLTSTGRLP